MNELDLDEFLPLFNKNLPPDIRALSITETHKDFTRLGLFCFFETPFGVSGTPLSENLCGADNAVPGAAVFTDSLESALVVVVATFAMAVVLATDCCGCCPSDSLLRLFW